MPGFNLDSFTGAIGKYGLASPNKFQVAIFGPGGESSGEDINLMCESASIAGRSVQSIMDLRYGLRREIAYNAPVYNPITLSFLCTGEYREKDYFDRWNNKIVNSATGFDVAYYKDYIGSMTVTTLDKNGKPNKNSYEIKYEEVYPKDITAIELNHSTTNATVKLTVTMNYSKWTTKSIPYHDLLQQKGHKVSLF